MNAWENEESEITVLMRDLYLKCSTLFDTLLFRFEQNSMRSSLTTAQNEEEKDQILFEIDENHKHVIAIGRLKSKYCKEVLRMSTRVSDFFMTAIFKFQLRRVFVKDYNMANVVALEVQSFQWCKRIVFTSRCVRLR